MKIAAEVLSPPSSDAAGINRSSPVFVSGVLALEVLRRNPDAVMVVLPADHWVADVATFRRTLKVAADLAVAQDQLVTIGIRPDYPETGYGYIMKAQALGEKNHGVFRVKRFTEKPTLTMARRLMRQGSLWNSGIFVWKAATLLELLNRYQPAIGSIEILRTNASIVGFPGKTGLVCAARIEWRHVGI